MITFQRGDIFMDDAEALVNPVNCVGVMGKGLALQFKQRFPENFNQYAQACRQGAVMPGSLNIHEETGSGTPRYLINFPTKRHWRDQSRLEDIREGLQALAREIRGRHIASVAAPALGSGLGGLDWKDVRHEIQQELAGLEGVRITVYEPFQAPDKRTS